MGASRAGEKGRGSRSQAAWFCPSRPPLREDALPTPPHVSQATTTDAVSVERP